MEEINESACNSPLVRTLERLQVSKRSQPKVESAISTREQMELPYWAEWNRALPNHISRTSIFSPVQPGRRILHDMSCLSSPKGVALYFSGKQLDMADQDVFLQVLHLARRYPLEERVYFTRADFLRDINRCVGSSDYRWLAAAINRLVIAAVFIETRRYKTGFHLIDQYDYDQKTGKYYVVLNQKVKALFSNSEYGLLDWQRRLELKRKIGLAKWLQSYSASHKKGQHKIGVDLLRQWCGWSGRARNFSTALTQAMNELVRVGIFSGARISISRQGNVQAEWVRE